jgi:hypothetical protein
MDDQEFSRRSYTAPADPALTVARGNSLTRTRTLRRAQQLDAHLRAAFEAAPLPEGLESRILLRQQLALRRERRRWTQAAFGLAASLLLGVGVVLYSGLPLPWQNLEQRVLAHMYHEPHSLEPLPELPLARVNALLGQHGIRADEGLGKVYYATNCPIGKQPGPHLVLAGEHKPVTVFILIGEEVHDSFNVADERFEGRVIAVPAGGMAIVGERGEPLAPVEGRLRSALRWQL